MKVPDIPFDQPIRVLKEEDFLYHQVAIEATPDKPDRVSLPFDRLLVDNLYKIRYNFFQSRSIEDIRERGVYVTGIKAFDSQIKNEQVDGYMTIQMAMDLFKRGVEMALVNPSELMPMYNEISDYLEHSMKLVQDSPNAQEETIRKIIDVDTFCRAVFEHAKFELKVSQTVDQFVRKISKGQQLPLINEALFVDRRASFDERAAEAHSVEYRGSEDILLERLALLTNYQR